MFAGPELSSLRFVLSELVLSKIGRSSVGRSASKSMSAGLVFALDSSLTHTIFLSCNSGTHTGPVKSGETALRIPLGCSTTTSCFPSKDNA